MSCFTPTLTRGLVSNLDDMPNGMKPLSFFQAVSLQLCLFFFFFLNMLHFTRALSSITSTPTVAAQACKLPFQCQLLTFATINLCNLGKMLTTTVS